VDGHSSTTIGIGHVIVLALRLSEINGFEHLHGVVVGGDNFGAGAVEQHFFETCPFGSDAAMAPQITNFLAKGEDAR
jgi:hypothetical protein